MIVRTLEHDEEKEIEANLTGKTLQVYWYLLSENREVGVREVQRALKMSSPSVASHHLNKLVNLGLVEKSDRNMYFLSNMVKVGVLKQFVRIRGLLLPSYVFVSVFFMTFLIAYAIYSLMRPVTIVDRILLLTACGVGLLFSAIETYRLWTMIK